MGLLDQIEKLINEHGSAPILKERIALANDKYAALEKKVTVLETKVLVLETENTKLQKEKERLDLNLRQAEVKIRDLEKQFSDSHSQHLDETAVQILTLIAQPDCDTETLIEQSGLHPQELEYLLNELAQQKYLDRGFTPRDEPYYTLKQKGRKFLIEHHLLPTS